jgi:hypothetical protein
MMTYGHCGEVIVGRSWSLVFAFIFFVGKLTYHLNASYLLHVTAGIVKF